MVVAGTGQRSATMAELIVVMGADVAAARCGCRTGWEVASDEDWLEG